MELDFLIRPATLSTKPRGDIHLPEFKIMTFDKNMELMRKIDYVREGVKVPTVFDEKFILEIPMNDSYKILERIRKLKFIFID
jgi:hypothetical protein